MTLGWQFALSLLVLIGVFGATIKTCLELDDQRQSKQEAEETESAQRQKKMRAILYDFRIHYSSNLIRVRLIENKSELTPELIYAWSQEPEVITLLGQQGLFGIVVELEEYAVLFKADEGGSGDVSR